MTKATESNTPIPSRRALLAGAPAVAAAALAAGTAVNGLAIAVGRPSGVDPIFAAIEACKNANDEWSRLYSVLDNACFDATKTYGTRPIELIQWRNYYIGGGEIEYRREEWLRIPPQRGVSPEKIEAEYRHVKSRYQAVVQAGRDWDERAGIAPLREQHDRATEAMNDARLNLDGVNPTSVAGVIALLRYAAQYEEECDEDLGSTIDAIRLADAVAKIEGARS